MPRIGIGSSRTEQGLIPSVRVKFVLTLRAAWWLGGMQVVANGSCHSIEGIKLEELGLKTGEAKLLVRGSLLGAAQDASIILTDFPVAVLQPFFRALPALEHAMPAVAASGAA